MSRKTAIHVVLAGVLFFVLHGAAQASNFNVSPILNEIPATSSVAVYEIHNLDNKPLSFQVQAFSWSQQNGSDVRVPAEDLLVVPPVATVPAGESQLVRIALRNKDRSRERAYRVVFRELPSQDPAKPGFTLKTTLAFDVPLFFATTEGTTKLTWRLERIGDRTIRVSAHNAGTRYAHFGRFRLMDSSGREIAGEQGSLYVLAGARKSWDVTTGTRLPRGATIKLVHSLGDQETVVPLKVE